VLEFVRSEADVPKGHERVGSMNVGLWGSTTPKKPGHSGSAARSGNPNNGVGTLSGVNRLQGAGGIGPRGGTPKQMTYVVGSQLQVSNSPSRSHHSTPSGGGGSMGEGGYLDTPGKGVRLSPLINSDDEKALRREVEGLDSGRGAPGPSGGSGGPSSSTKMRIGYGKQPLLEPPILKENETCFDGVTGPLVTSQGENSAAIEKTFQHVYSRGNPSLYMRVSAGSRYRGKIPLMGPFSPPWRRVVVHLGFGVSPTSTFNSPPLVALLLSLIETVIAVLSQPNTLRMRSCIVCLIMNGLLLISVRLGLPFLVWEHGF
jgi:hypothetical protein